MLWLVRHAATEPASVIRWTLWSGFPVAEPPVSAHRSDLDIQDNHP